MARTNRVVAALSLALILGPFAGAQVRTEQTWALMIGMMVYTLLLAVPACLLVRFETPVQTLAEAVAHAVAAPHRHPAVRAHRAVHRPHGPHRPVVHHCLCPGGG